VTSFLHAGVLQVDEVLVLRVVVDEGAHDGADDRRRLPLRAHVVEDPADNFRRDALVAEFGMHRCGQQHDPVAGEAVGDAADLGVADDGLVDAVLLSLTRLKSKSGFSSVSRT